MKFSSGTILLAFGLLNSARGDTVPYERINKNDSMILVVDHQVGLFNLVKDWDSTVFANNIMAHAEMAKLFDLPVVMTTSTEQGPNGPLPSGIIDMYPDAPLIMRKGEVNAWDSPEFREAVRAAGKSQIIIGGIVTDVCTTFLALSLRAEGYSVYANIEASGTTSELIRDTANSRMERAGVNLLSMFAIICELMRDWRSTPGAKEVFPYLEEYFPLYGMLKQGHNAAVENGTIV